MGFRANGTLHFFPRSLQTLSIASKMFVLDSVKCHSTEHLLIVGVSIVAVIKFKCLIRDLLQTNVHMWFAWNLTTLNMVVHWEVWWHSALGVNVDTPNVSYFWSWKNGYGRWWYRWWEQNKTTMLDVGSSVLSSHVFLVYLRKEVIPIQVKILEHVIWLTTKHLVLHSFRLHYSIK